MNVSYRWLQALAPSIQGTPREVADRLALLGAPVDEVADLGAEIGGVVIARVDDVRPHPNADRLRVCTVDAGSGAPVQVVCGAPNVQAGGFYPFAPVGATLPGGMEIKRAKLRGQASEGMLCSARELGLGRDHGGLMALAGEWTPGEPLVPALGLDDARLLVDVTPNRGELLSHLGVARELADGGADGVVLPSFPGGSVADFHVPSTGAEGEVAGVRIRIEDTDGCPRLTAAVVRGVRVGPSPEWLASRLRAVGLRPINNVVDATNYVLMEVGQPLHAYDLAKIQGPELRVRRAAEGERFTTLDGTERALAPNDLMIADAERSVGIAGVMGGENSEVGDETTDLLLECAVFDPRSVRKTARRLGLSTDASYRFERGVDPEGQPRALRRLAELIVAVAGGEVVAAVDCNPVPHQRRTIDLRPERVSAVLGVPLSAAEVAGLLRPLGFGIADDSASPLRVDVPGYRPDVTGEIDLVEEVARSRGYDSFPEETRPFRASEVPEDPSVAVVRRLQGLFLRHGFLESRTAAFAPEAAGSVPLLNPLSAEEGVLRASLVPGLLRRVEHNFARGARDVRLFETGTVFAPGEGAVAEEIRVAAAFTGASRPPHWSGAAPAFDAWDLKGLLEELAAEYPQGSVDAGDAGTYAPLADVGLRFRLLSSGDVVGGGGRAGDGTVDAPAWAGDVWVLEARIPPKAATTREATYRPLPLHPAVERDLALLLPDGVAAAELAETLRGTAGEWLESLLPFDLYAGKGIPEGTRSVAWRLRFRTPDRTLTDAEVDAAVARVLAAAEERHGVRRR